MGRKSDARERLMDAVTELIWVRSYGAVTIDAICERAAVKKGSFYYFFRSKADLSVAAVGRMWQSVRPDLDDVFSASRLPLERLRLLFEHAHARQTGARDKHGRVLGCLFCSLGTEVCALEPDVLAEVREVMRCYVRYIESAILDAAAVGSVGVHARNAPAVARGVFALLEGSLAQARIHNDPSLVSEAGLAAMLMLTGNMPAPAPNAAEIRPGVSQ